MFYTGLKIFGAGLAIFFVIFFYFCLLWTERFEKKPGQESKVKIAVISALVVSLLYCFKIFLIGVASLAAISLFLRYVF